MGFQFISRKNGYPDKFIKRCSVNKHIIRKVTLETKEQIILSHVKTPQKAKYKDLDAI